MKLSLATALMLWSGASAAGNLNSLNACRIPGLVPHPPARQLVVAIDQTTPLTTSLQQLIADNIKPFLQPGTQFSVVVFSAYTQGRFTEVLSAGTLDMEPADRSSVAKPLLVQFDQCMKLQAQQAAKVVGASLRKAFVGSSASIGKSDVLASLKAVSSILADHSAKDKVLLVASDMLENSSVTAFYGPAGQSVRMLDPDAELRLVEKNQLLGNFAGARAYVIGAGLLAEDAGKRTAYRDPKTMRQLNGFWSSYFSRSNAKLVEFGQPALLRPVQ